MLAAFYAGVCHYFLGRWEHAESHLRAAVSFFQKTGDVFTLELAHENIGYTLFWRGDFDGAGAHFRRALGLSEEVGDHRGEVVSRMSIALISCYRGDLDAATEQIVSAAQLVASVRDNSLKSSVLRVHGVINLALGNRAQALNQLEQAYELVKEHRLVQEYVAPTCHTLVEVLLGSAGEFQTLTPSARRRTLNRARRLVRAARLFGRRFPAHQGGALRAAGVLHLRRGRLNRALACFSDAARVQSRMGMRYELAQTLEATASAHHTDSPEHVGAAVMALDLHRLLGTSPRAGSVLRQAKGAVAGAFAARTEPDHLRTLLEAGRQLGSTLDLGELLRLTMSFVMDVTRAERGLLLLFTDDGHGVEVRLSAYGEGGVTDAGEDFSSSSVVALVKRSREPVLVSDALVDARLQASDSVFANRLRSLLCFPLLVRGEPRGVIYLENNTASNCFGGRHLDLVRVFAPHASAALENSLAYREVEALNRELEAKVELRTREWKNASDNLRTRNVELKKTLRELTATQEKMVQQAKLVSLGQLAAGATHEINNPLNFILSGAYALCRRADRIEELLGEEAADPELTACLERLVELSAVVANGCERIKSIVDGLWSLAEQRQTIVSAVDLEEVLNDTVLLLGPNLPPGVVVTQNYRSAPPVMACAAELKQVFLNLVMNAAEAVGDQGRVELRLRPHQGETEVEVADNGCGIPADQQELIFEPFFSSKEMDRGRGLGLSICLNIVQRYHGGINVRSHPEKGTTFQVRFPAAPEGDRAQTQESDSTEKEQHGQA